MPVIGLNDYEFQLGDDGTTLNTDSTGIPFVDIDKVSGLDSTPYRETFRDHEGQDGGFIDAEFETGRDIILDGTIYCNPANVEPFLDSLKQQFAPRTSSIPLYFKSSGVVERQFNVKPRGVRFDWDTAKNIGITNVQFLMYAEDPRAYSSQVNGVTIPFGGPATTGFGFNPYYDMFDRTSSSTWGTTTSGTAYTAFTGGTSSEYNVSGGFGKHTHSATNTSHISVLPAVSPNFDLTVGSSIPVAPATQNITRRILGRYTDSSNYYAANLIVTPAGNVTLALTKNVAGTFTGFGPSAVTIGTHTPGDIWYVNFVGSGSIFQAKAWKAGTATPTTWTVEGTDSSLTTGSNYALYSRVDTGNTNTLPLDISWDNLQINEGFGFNLSFGAVVPVTGGIVSVGGNRPTPAIMTIEGPVVNPRIVNVTDGLTLDFVITLVSGDTLAIDLRNRTVTLNGGENRRSALQQPNWWLFNPGDTFVVFGGGSGTGDVIIQWQDAWR